MYGLPRGILNNNPLNIRISNQTFEGEIIPSKDPSFKQFETAIMGIRAGVKILGNYYKIHQLSTIAQIINRWAPTNENNTSSYITDVCKHMGIGQDDVLDLTQSSVLASLVKAVILHENGEQPYSDDDINSGVELVLS